MKNQVNPFDVIEDKAVRRATPPNQPPLVSGANFGSGLSLDSSPASFAAADGSTIHVLMWDIDNWDDSASIFTQ